MSKCSWDSGSRPRFERSGSRGRASVVPAAWGRVPPSLHTRPRSTYCSREGQQSAYRSRRKGQALVRRGANAVTGGDDVPVAGRTTAARAPRYQIKFASSASLVDATRQLVARHYLRRGFVRLSDVGPGGVLRDDPNASRSRYFVDAGSAATKLLQFMASGVSHRDLSPELGSVLQAYM